MRKLVRIGTAMCVAVLSALGTWPTAANPTSPNGQILFARYDPTLDDTLVYTVNPDGSHQHLVLPFALECPRWSPDGTQIATCGTHSGHLSGATIVDPDTGSYRELPGPGEPDLATACYVWTPDAKRLACDSWSDNHPRRNGIYTIRTSDGKGLTQVTSNPFGGDVPGDYSPNGKRLVFSRYDQDGNLGVFVVHSDGTHLRRITPADGDGGDWSPQGNEIVFTRHLTPDLHGSLWIVHANGTGLREIPAHPAYGCGGPWSDPNAGGCFDPHWSPDGTRIVFGAGDDALGRNVYTVRPDGTGLHQITYGDTSQSNDSPDWGTHRLAP